jgi:hypothetical protein
MMSNGITVAPQSIRALELANRVRAARADLKRRVSDGELEAAEIVLACPPEATTMAISELLRAQRHWGGVRCHRLLSAAALRENKTIGSMTERQRHQVAVLLSTTAD